MNILIADKLAHSAQKSLENMNCVVQTDASLCDERLSIALRESQTEVLIVRSTKVRTEHIDASKKLSMIIRAGAGTNTIDVEYASKKGIYVANCPGKNAIAVAELTRVTSLIWIEKSQTMFKTYVKASGIRKNIQNLEDFLAEASRLSVLAHVDKRFVQEQKPLV